MLRSYLILAYRNITRNKVFSFINIMGLAIGLAACLLIFQFVTFEFSYDTFNEKFDRIYRVTNDRFQNGELIQHGTIMYPTIGPTMAKDYDEVEEYTRLMPGGTFDAKVDNKLFKGDELHFADNHFFSVFTFPLLAGDKRSVLEKPNSVVLTETTARKYFDVRDNDFSSLLGRIIYEGTHPEPITVTGICKNVPSNSHIQFDVLLSYSTLISPEHHEADDSWTWSDMRHYLVLKPGVDYKALEAKFPDFSDRYFQGDKVSGSVEKFYLQPLKDAHLYSDYEYDIAKRSSGKAVWAMLIVALFILLIGWINYINLTTSKALERAKEVGLRKVMGAVKGQLVRQFIFESVLISLMALLFAIGLSAASQSTFNQIVGNNLSLWKVVTSANASAIFVAVAVLAGGILLAGFYPAFILSSYQPSAVLKGKFSRSTSGNILRKALVVFQFTASAALITSTVIVSRQLEFINDADLGIDLSHIMIVDPPTRTSWDSTYIDRVESFKHGLRQLDNVVSVSTSGRLPGWRLGRTFDVRLKNDKADNHYTMSNFPVDHDFFTTYNVSTVAGRVFEMADHKPEWEAIDKIVVNRNAASLLGFKDPGEIVGRVVNFWNRDWTVIGVVENFHQESFRSPMEPIFFYPVYQTGASTSLKMKGDDTQKMIDAVRAEFETYFPGNLFDYYFIEDSYMNQYQDDNRFSKVIGIFTFLAIVISCLGLIGLSSYTTSLRTKEIGVRKALGASVRHIVVLLSGSFIKLVMISSVLAVPIAYVAMQSWLSGYVYRITPDIPMFVLPVLVVLTIAALTISFQVMKTALINPAATLKSE